MISYAQNFEDVMIARVFDPDYKGYFIDIGAGHPTYNSVTCHFYHSGWRGLNVEPSLRLFSLLVMARPRDINLRAVVGDASGRATFTDDSVSRPVMGDYPRFATAPGAAEGTAESIEVEIVTLPDLWQRHIGARTVDVMRIDLAGAAPAALAGGDWQMHRPRLLLVKAARADAREESQERLEPRLMAEGYEKVWFDGVSSFYLREEDSVRREVFRLPPNISDGFEPALALNLWWAADDVASRQRGPSSPAPIRVAEVAETAALRTALDEERAARAVLSALVANLDAYSQSFAGVLETEIDLRRIADRAYEDVSRDMLGLIAELERLKVENADLHRKYDETRRRLQSVEADRDLFSRQLAISRAYAGVVG